MITCASVAVGALRHCRSGGLGGGCRLRGQACRCPCMAGRIGRTREGGNCRGTDACEGSSDSSLTSASRRPSTRSLAAKQARRVRRSESVTSAKELGVADIPSAECRPWRLIERASAADEAEPMRLVQQVSDGRGDPFSCASLRPFSQFVQFGGNLAKRQIRIGDRDRRHQLH